ncbi:MAG: glycosyltransferase, partial [Pseudomonas sp.]|nr:glycosyltransferase [Pseudomonas sp.]
MDWVDSIAIYWFLVKLLLITTAVLIAISSFDDLFIDICYWCRRIYQRLAGVSATETPSLEVLRAADERPIAIMVPAWQEADVIAQMLHNALTVFDYKRFHIFVGTYPNDYETQREVDAVAAANPTIHKVVGARSGPTCKADCLNEVIASILEFETKQGIRFAAFVLQDSEDVVHPLELRLFNYMVARY